MAETVVRVTRSGWWAARSLREKRLLLAMGALLALVIVWLAVIRPLIDARAAAEQRLNLAVTELARARAEAAAMAQAAPGPNMAPVPLPVDGFLMQSAAEQGLTNLQVVADGAARATISIANVRPQAFFGWIGQLEARGLVVESMSARTNADQSIAAEAVLRARTGR
ncbi:MAG TPA: type II secretion system protein GspM [Allosphingosinicella sp.]|jgi:general secretion pathway protein M